MKLGTSTTIQNEQSQTDSMEAQFQNDFNTWFNSVKDVLDTNTIGNLNNEIDAIPKVYKGTDSPITPAVLDIWIKSLGSGNIQLTERNTDNTMWNEVFPKTKAENVMTNVGLDLEAQLAELQKIQTAGGTTTAIILTNISFSNGFTKTFIVSLNNSGASTTINGKPLYKPNTTTSPTLSAGKAVTVWYNLANDCFFIKASAEGNTIAAPVLAGDNFSNDSDTNLVGTMPNNGALNKSLPINGTYAIPEGYTSGGTVTQSITTKGSATITPTTTNQTIASGQYLTGTQTISGDANLITSNIKSGVSIFGISGKSSVVETSDATAVASKILTGYTAYVNGSKLDGAMTNITADQNALSAAKSGTTIGLKVPAGYWDGTRNVNAVSTTIDGNLTASNILNGVSILGVTGRKTASESTTSIANNSSTYHWWVDVTGYSRNYDYVEVTGLSFNPNYIVVCYKNSSTQYTTIYEASGNSYVAKTIKYLSTSLTSYSSGTYYEFNGNTYTKVGTSGNIPCVSYGFCLPVALGGVVFQWFAIE